MWSEQKNSLTVCKGYFCPVFDRVWFKGDYIPNPVQKLGFDCVDFLLNSSFALRAVSINTATHLKEIILKIFLSNSQLLNRIGYTDIEVDISGLELCQSPEVAFWRATAVSEAKSWIVARMQRAAPVKRPAIGPAAEQIINPR
jgi:hypothetical protein